ncbi:pyridoxamine 5'-phosphate oxidase family protein [Actinocorallia longicatena]|uniref:Pyridoxamine 5'-phosphate oxidase N-terminal domain-containing protein n=1 Tax=Actinocorallia longicatena TaxID=111803 RepID=A0ABP6PZV7_9ACTN
MEAPRTAERRRRDTLDRLENDVDAWIATADPGTGTPHLVPLSFLWEGETLLISTAAATPTARNLAASGLARVGVGPTRDLVLIEASAEALDPASLPAALGDAFAAKTGFDPRAEPNPYLYFRLTPSRVRAWREVNELKDRDITPLVARER